MVPAVDSLSPRGRQYEHRRSHRAVTDAAGGLYVVWEDLRGMDPAEVRRRLNGLNEEFRGVKIPILHAGFEGGEFHPPGVRAAVGGDDKEIAEVMIRAKEADALVSPGNTGAVMASSLLTLGRIEGVQRPAIAALFPT